MTESLVGGASAAPLSIRAAATLTSAVVKASRQLLTDLERGRRIDATVLRGAMEAAFGASDATGARKRTRLHSRPGWSSDAGVWV